MSAGVEGDVWYVTKIPEPKFAPTALLLKSHCHHIKLRLSFFYSSPPSSSAHFSSPSKLTCLPFFSVSMWLCIQPRCKCNTFIPISKQPKVCSVCGHGKSSHYSVPSSDEEDESGGDEIVSLGTLPYIERLQKSVAKSAVVEAIAETTSGFRPKAANRKVLPFSRHKFHGDLTIRVHFTSPTSLQHPLHRNHSSP